MGYKLYIKPLKMKRNIILTIFAVLLAMSASAQSTMTDTQVMEMLMKEKAAGTSQKQIVTKLMQSGVDIQQLRRVQKLVERDMKGTGLGNLSSSTSTQDRSRVANGKRREDYQQKESTSHQVKDLSRRRVSQRYDETNPEWLDMQQELNTFMPDSTALLEQLLAERDKNKKKVFGRDIFNNNELTFEPNMNIATPQNYRLGPGDAVFIDIYGASQKTIESTVSPDGTVTIEGYGPVNVAGMTVSQANAHLRSTLGSRYSSSQIKLTVGQTRTIMVNVMGEVKMPGTYTLSAFATVFHALYMAGGTNDLGTLRNIKVFRNNKLVTVVDIYDYMLNGKLTGNVRLADNDVIVVGPYDCLVNITGKVKRPMIYEMRKNESVNTLLKYAGGFTGDAYTKQVRLVRKTGRDYSVHNIEEFDFSSFQLADEDSVSVDSIISRFSNMVELKGAVFRPGMYQVGGQIYSVRSLLESAEGLKEEAFTAHAVMHRMKSDRTKEVLPIDVEGILSGEVADIPLKPNDVLFIPTKKEMMEKQTITIHGEVQFPGIYEYADNETLEDFILQAGGLKESASTVKVDVARRVSNPKALTTDSLISYTYSFALKDGFVIDGESGFHLQPYDEVYVRKSPGYYQQQNVYIDGEVMFAGTYTLSKKDQRLSDLVKVAGGVNDRAFVKGARLERRYTPEERLRAEAVLRKAREEMEANLLEQAARTGNNSLGNLSNAEQLRKYEIGSTYPVGIELDKALAHPGSSDDIILREGDRLVVPQYEATVKVNGEVMYPNTVSYIKGKSASYYIDQAGGFSNKAKKRKTYIIYMNGKVETVAHNAKPEPGCEIIVPSKSLSKTSISETLSIATGVSSFAAVIATLISLIK